MKNTSQSTTILRSSSNLGIVGIIGIYCYDCWDIILRLKEKIYTAPKLANEANNSYLRPYTKVS